MVIFVAVVDDVVEETLSGTAALPASSNCAVMPVYVFAKPAAVLAVSAKLSSFVDWLAPTPQVLLGAPEKPLGSVPVRHQ
jgi:hypothetical protein